MMSPHDFTKPSINRVTECFKYSETEYINQSKYLLIHFAQCIPQSTSHGCLDSKHEFGLL